MEMYNKNEANEQVITGYRVGTHIRYEGITRKEYYVRGLVLRGFGKNPKIMKTEEKAQEFLDRIKEKTGNEDLFIDPVYVTGYVRKIGELRGPMHR